MPSLGRKPGKGKQPADLTDTTPSAVLDRVLEEGLEDHFINEPEASTSTSSHTHGSGRVSRIIPASHAESSRTSTSSRSARDNAGSPSSSQASTVGKVADGEFDEGQSSVSSLGKTSRNKQASAYSPTPLLDGTRGLIHDLTTIEFNFGGLPIRLRLGLLWFLMLVIGGILLIRSQALQSGGGQAPIGPPPPTETPAVGLIGAPVSLNGTDIFASAPEISVPICPLDFVFNATTGFCDLTGAAKSSLNTSDSQTAPTLPSCLSGQIYDQNSKTCVVLLSGGALVNTSSDGLRDVHSLVLAAQLYSNLQRTLPFWGALAVLLAFNIVSIAKSCGMALGYLLLPRYVWGLWIRRNQLQIPFFLGDIAIVAYIIIRLKDTGLSTDLSQTRTYACMALVQPARSLPSGLVRMVQWLFGKRYSAQDDEVEESYEARPTQPIRDRLRYKISSLDDMLERYRVRDSSWRHPLRTLAKWIVRGSLLTARLFLLLLQALLTGDAYANVADTDRHAGEVDIQRAHTVGPFAPPLLYPFQLSHERFGTAGYEPTTEQWIHAIAEPALEHPDKPLRMARDGIDSSIDLESGSCNGLRDLETFSSRSI